jgi:tRNA dimethylallyltransferase
MVRWRPLILVVTGATAVGKTDVALMLADTLPVDLISLDSAMVYRGMDIGTAKPSPEVLARHPHALVNIRDPAEPYSAADFLHDADEAVRGSLAAGRIPLLVGGTMLYLKVFREGLAAMPGADPAVRRQLKAEASVHGWPALHARLAEVDPLAAAGMHPHNAARIERALEVFELTGRPMSSFWQAADARPARERHGASVFEFAVQPDSREALHARISERLEAMLEAGFVDEVAALRARRDLSLELPAMKAVGYRQIWEFLEGRTSEAEMRERALAATRQLAKRQLTWLRSFAIRSLIWGSAAGLADQVRAAARLELS